VTEAARFAPKVVALSGGVGGAKLARGLAAVLEPDDLLIVANTGDDFEHLGLHISPDIDSLFYALARLNDAERGWGRKDESWNFMAALGALGGPAWFQLGDRDLATHVVRTQRLAAGESLTDVTAALANAFGIRHQIVPMSDQSVRTRVATPEGELDFQRYFVVEQCRPRVIGFRFVGAEGARPSPVFAAGLASPRLEAVVICPSNPFVSIDPILSLPGLRERLATLSAPVIAVTPIIGGAALKGPAAKMLAELGHEVSPVGVARRYVDLLDGFVLDARDAVEAARLRALGLAVVVTSTVMRDAEGQCALARAALELTATLRRRPAPVE